MQVLIRACHCAYLWWGESKSARLHLFSSFALWSERRQVEENYFFIITASIRSGMDSRISSTAVRHLTDISCRGKLLLQVFWCIRGEAAPLVQWVKGGRKQDLYSRLHQHEESSSKAKPSDGAPFFLLSGRDRSPLFKGRRLLNITDREQRWNGRWW